MIDELEQKNGVVVPASFPAKDEKEAEKHGLEFWDLSEGNESSQGKWATGSAPDGSGDFIYLSDPAPQGQKPIMNRPDASLHHDLDHPGSVEKMAKKVTDHLKGK